MSDDFHERRAAEQAAALREQAKAWLAVTELEHKLTIAKATLEELHSNSRSISLSAALANPRIVVVDYEDEEAVPVVVTSQGYAKFDYQYAEMNPDA